MPQSRVFTFTDPDDFQERVRASEVAFLTLSGSEFRANLTQITFDRLWMQWGSDTLARIARSTIDPNRTVAMFLADPQQPAAQVGGSQMTYDSIVVHGRGSTNIVRTQGNHRWASLSLSHGDLAAAGEAIASREIVCPMDTYLIAPPPATMAQLRALHVQAIDLANTAPEVLANPAVAKALEQQMTRAMVASLTGDTPSERRWLPGQHARIVNRFLEFLEARPDEPVYLAEICTAIGASERTLRTCCQEVLGAGPLRYLWMRRMHLARRALMHADASMTTVTEIATAHGFWELGRFSVEYRTLFGESPSQSLRQSGTKTDIGPRAAHVRMG
jgi:AraC-like DNA-binding protein